MRKDIQIGQLVSMPFRDKIEAGIVLSLDKNPDGVDITKIKSLIEIRYPEALLDEKRVELVKFISHYYFTTIHQSLNLFFPANIRKKISTSNFRLDSEDREYSYIYQHKSILTGAQQKIYDECKNGEMNNYLLYGITGSGKTEIYIKLMKDYLDKGKQVVFLVPEIILNNQIGERVIKVFGEDVVVINSSVTLSKKEKYWKDIYYGKAQIIVGTRSALFYPFMNLGLIIVDEEHDNSYLSDKAPRYNSIELTEKISELYQSKLLLASGTPSIISMTKAIKGEYKLLNLLEKYNP